MPSLKILTLETSFCQGRHNTAANASRFQMVPPPLAITKASVAVAQQLSVAANIPAWATNSQSIKIDPPPVPPRHCKVMEKAGWSVADVDLFEDQRGVRNGANDRNEGTGIAAENSTSTAAALATPSVRLLARASSLLKTGGRAEPWPKTAASRHCASAAAKEQRFRG
jgi:acetyl-CoA C-acetyltransferase